ncbi:MAG: hypothetical protein ACI945_000076 [Pseudohongiellaceae bacterium]|jgi:hypothetical protein
MSSTTFESLRETLKNLRRRRRNLLILKHGSYFSIGAAVAILAVLLFAAWWQPDRNETIALFVGMLFILGGLGWLLLRSVNQQSTDDRRLAHYVEDHIPDLEQRLMTSLEFSEEELLSGRKGVSQQFIQQLWQDAQIHVDLQQHQVEAVTPANASWYTFAGAAAAASIVLALVTSSDSLFNAASRLIWPFAIEEPVTVVEVRPTIEISVEPGTIDMQRGESVTIVATVTNAIPGTINLRLQNDNVNWQDVTMNREGSGSESASYSFFIPSIDEDTNYYVNFDEAGEQSSPQYQITLFDLPQVEMIDLEFDYPEYTLLDNYREENSGDMIVPEGTVVDFSVTFNKPIREALLMFGGLGDAEGNEGDKIGDLAPYENIELDLIESNVGRGQFTVTRDGIYQITAKDFDDLESIDPLDYFIRVIEDTPPELVLQRPGSDQDVMPLEEVVIEVSASDDYGLSKFALNYSVVGADEVEVDFLPSTQTKQITGDELIYLEDLSVEPGDFVSYYFTLADNNGLDGPAEVVSDIYFLQVVPTDQEFRRTQGSSGGQGAGGGQGGGDSSALVSVQKDIIAATWKLKNRQSQVSQEEFENDSEIIAESQREATDRANKSIERLSERLNFSDDTYDNAVENLSLAIVQMNLAAADLDIEQVTSALKPEQLALQYILKAEANINRTDISMQQSGGGGGSGSAAQEREDLRDLFEMEMGQLENRYETPDSRKGGSPESAAEADKLEELARRQEGLTRAQRNLARREEQMTPEQKRRELERLKRQQEQLSQEVAQLAQQMSRAQQQSPSQQGQSSSASQAQSQSGGSASSGEQSPLQRAAQQMQQAAQSETAAIAAARSQKALENMREQQREMGGEAERSVNQLAQNLGQRGQQLLQQQRALQDSLQDKIREQGLGQTRQETRASGGLEELVQAQQQQQRNLDEIEDMLRAIIARGDNEDQRLMSQAQAATRELRPIKEEMQTSNRVLRNGMVNLAVDIEQELQTPMEGLAQSLLALNPASGDSASDRIQTAANDAEALREQIEELQNQVEAFSAQGEGEGQGSRQESQGEAGSGAPTVREMREQLKRSQQLAQQLSNQIQESQAGGQPGQGGGRPQIGGRGNPQQSGGTQEAQTADNTAGNARTIRQQLTQQGIEDFLNQPELFSKLLQPIIELEGALRAQAELDSINNKLYSAVDEDIPDEYRELVEEYYRVLSENQGSVSGGSGVDQ